MTNYSPEMKKDILRKSAELTHEYYNDVMGAQEWSGVMADPYTCSKKAIVEVSIKKLAIKPDGVADHLQMTIPYPWKVFLETPNSEIVEQVTKMWEKGLHEKGGKSLLANSS
jgi:hypothetical protein